MNVLSDTILLKFLESSSRLEMYAIDSDLKNPAVVVTSETRREMSFEEFSKFIGERVVLISPSLRKEFEDYLWSPDGSPPKKTANEGR